MNIETLRKQYRAGKKFKYIFFGDINQSQLSLLKVVSANGIQLLLL